MRHRPAAVGRQLLAAGAATAMAGCNRLASIPYTPQETPESWLRVQPFVEFRLASGTITLVQPTTTAIVYLLGLVAISAGVWLFRFRTAQRSRLWWAIALVLWGVGALLAGTSYEAFSYHLKCAGRTVCAWTSWWEIWYLIAAAASVDAILVAHAYSSAAGRSRRLLIRYAVIHVAVYGIAVLVGAFVPIRGLISFETLLLACAPNVALAVIHTGWRYRAYRRPMDRVLLRAWSWLGLTVGAYYLYLASGFTGWLWLRGVWWSENDVLHAGSLVWVGYIVFFVAAQLEDEPDALATDSPRRPPRKPSPCAS
jgi:hypothetical protein